MVIDNLTTREKAACRAVDNLLNRTTAGWAEMEHADRHYDGGEWSGPAWGNNWQAEEKRVIALVARHFGFTSPRLVDAYYYWEHLEEEYFWDRNGRVYDATLMDPEANR